MKKKLVIALLSGSIILGKYAGADAALLCQPSEQTIRFGEFSEHSAQGGDGQSYTWSAFPGAIQESGSTFFATYSWSRIGTKRVTVTSGGETSECVVNVRGVNRFSVSKEVRNETLNQVAFRDSADVRQGQTIVFTITLAVDESDEAGPFRVIDSFPAGLSYVAGSARANGNSISDPTRFGAGLAFTDIAVPSGASVEIMYSAIADMLDTIAEGSQSVTYNVAVTDSMTGQTDTGAGVELTLFGTRPVTQTSTGGIGQVPVGPDDTVIVALVAAIVSSLLYAAYTRSDSFRSREVRTLQRNQNPLDFRG